MTWTLSRTGTTFRPDHLLAGTRLMPAWSLSSPTVRFALCSRSCNFSALSFISGPAVVGGLFLIAVEIATRSLCIIFVYSLAHVSSAISAGFTCWDSVTVLSASSSIATCVASQRSPHKWEDTYGPRSALLANALGWSSEKWSKASERATVGLDQGRSGFSMSIPTFPRLH